MNSWKCQKRRVNRVSLEGFVSSVSRGGGMYLPMQLSPDFWYGQPKRLASGETTAASFAVRRALIEVQLPLRPQLSQPILWILQIFHANMRPTSACLAPGFLKRSLDEFKRLSNFGELCSCMCWMRRH